MKYVSTKKMKALDEAAIQRYGIPSLILMENAGRGIADLAEKMIRKPQGDSVRRPCIVIVTGKGNNGGDGFVAARHLYNRGFQVEIFLIGDSSELKDDPSLNFRILKKMNLPIQRIQFSRDVRAFEKRLNARGTDEPRLVIDAIFGVGLALSVDGIFRATIEAMNRSGRPVLSVDVPSGLESDSGKVLGSAVRALATGTLGALKHGLVLGEGPKHSGKVTVLDISIPRDLLTERGR